MAQRSMVVMKKTKRSEQETDIRPLIYRFEPIDGRIFMQLAAGSVHNLKPELVMETFYRYMGKKFYRMPGWSTGKRSIKYRRWAASETGFSGKPG